MTLPSSDGTGNEILEKRTRFSLSHDEGSIGNTSDNLEAISEAASNHSATSSLEDEVDQEDEDNPIIDNLSDMVSANVSGRGTPNVSGRDTPSSQVPDDDEGVRSGREDEAIRGAAGGSLGSSSRSHHRHIHPTKSGQADLEEKFGRFEIKPQIKSRGSVTLLGAEGGDETVSLISDTWSTDVLPSDTETLGELLGSERGGAAAAFPPNNNNFADMDAFSRNLILEEFATSSSAGAAAALPQRMSGIQPCPQDESSDDILNKYRSKKPPQAVGNLIDVSDCPREEETVLDPRLIIDHNNLEACYAFKDAKRKLRLTLSSVDLSMMPDICHASSVEPEGLLCTLSMQERLLSRMNIDRDVCTSYLVYVVVRFFLEEREKSLHMFVQKFKELTVPDEKTALMNSFLSSMNEALLSDPIWSSVSSEEQRELSRVAIERSLTSHIYFSAMYPNGEADINRDEVLSEHISKLGGIISPHTRTSGYPSNTTTSSPGPPHKPS
ncbi:GTPaseactivating protein and VPS9 domaincontaining protein 1like [Caligus rogercresseyi]|uniref:GTPaseactivating protein and VPS9 domaincontaining protein 1like n=1 Tax=Caligus rogercresseyi TaxID=217165 RepID=A0A7T8JVS1_CALRO|nr:GTPaseactivating protein and VPS9 domaincontaining protein 1like [Caligus rogercresseyi]